MIDRSARRAAQANADLYDSTSAATYLEGAPHLKHASLRTLYMSLLVRVVESAQRRSPMPTALDLGAGDGTATLPLLELGARVTAVDISSSQLDLLRGKCARFADRLRVKCQDVNEAIAQSDERYDIIVANSFLHHVPDYLGLVAGAVRLLEPWGRFVSFQDPLRYDRLPAFARVFSSLAYLSWRVFRGDVVGGVRRRLRRSRGIYLDDSIHDNAEYHVTRNGVDADAISAQLVASGFECEVIRYFSTQASVFQAIGGGLKVKNTFAIVARRGSTQARRRR